MLKSLILIMTLVLLNHVACIAQRTTVVLLMNIFESINLTMLNPVGPCDLRIIF